MISFIAIYGKNDGSLRAEVIGKFANMEDAGRYAEAKSRQQLVALIDQDLFHELARNKILLAELLRK